ncbi:hypothetical protein ACQ4PT_024623 [Festuca glaucescens]
MVKFNGLNYAEWADHIDFQLGVMNLDMAIVMEKPATPTDESTDEDKKKFELWERANRLSLNFMRMMIAKNVKPSMPKTENAKEFMLKLKEFSQSDLIDKFIMGTLMSELTTKKFDWSCAMHDHVTSLTNVAAKLKTMGMDVGETFVVQFIMNSLPPEFGQFQVNYNTIKDKWNLQAIKAMLIQEEGRLKKIRDHSVYFMAHNEASSSKPKPGFKGKRKDNVSLKINQGQVRKDLNAALYAPAASLGHIDALGELGYCLQDSYGVRYSLLDGRRLLIQDNASEVAAASASLFKAFRGATGACSATSGAAAAARDAHAANRFLSEWFVSRPLGAESGLGPTTMEEEDGGYGGALRLCSTRFAGGRRCGGMSSGGAPCAAW